MKSLMTDMVRNMVHFISHGNSEQVLRVCKLAKFELGVARSLRRWRERFRQFQGQKDLKLNVGCGPNAKPGWVNIDLNQEAEFPYDIRRGLPIADESCSIVYSEHFFEHLSYEHASLFVRESYRVLQPGGLFRVVFPDFQAIFRAYLNHDADYFKPLKGWSLVAGLDSRDATLIDYVNYAVYQFGEHLCLWDEDKLRQCLRQAGFVNITRSQFQPDLDSQIFYRRHFSFYFQAWK